MNCFWRTSGSGRRSNVPAGTRSKGYVFIGIRGAKISGHHLAWFYKHKVWTDAKIDHVNGISDDNRINNLRKATHAENGRNRKLNENNTSGYKGIYRGKGGKWVARTMFEQRYVHIGCFDSAEEAARAYDAKARELFGRFARCNFSD